ncbi:MAG: hypothetical protein K6G90_01185 [Clostridia bacterium]|nr:hypothetical protein [Clostridia bacterium]
MNITGNGRKQYVEVNLTCRIDGTWVPRFITLATGEMYAITRSSGPTLCKAGYTGELTNKYTVRINNKDTNLFEDNGRWFVEMKN